MIRRIENIDRSHDKLCVKCNSTTERDDHRRIFPHPMPDTHRLAYRWTSETEYEVFVELIPLPGDPMVQQQEPPTPTVDAKLMIDLQKMKRDDLMTMATENSIAYQVNTSNAKLIAELVRVLGAKSPPAAKQE